MGRLCVITSIPFYEFTPMRRIKDHILQSKLVVIISTARKKQFRKLLAKNAQNYSEITGLRTAH